MSTPWFVVKYMPDLYRREPRNVGVVLLDEHQGLVRFIGQDPASGDFNQRWASQFVAATNTYQQWVEYFTHHVERGSFEKALNSLRNRPLDNYVVEHGGTYEKDYSDPHSVIEELFRGLVDDNPVPPAEATPAKQLLGLVNQVLRQARIDNVVEKGPAFDVEIRGVRSSMLSTLKFDYSYQNGVTTLMERVPLSPQRRSTNVERVQELLYRIEHVLASGIANRFIAFYTAPPTEESRELIEPQIRLLETNADVLDVGNVPEAATNLRERLAIR